MPDWIFDARKVVVVLAVMGAALYWAFTPGEVVEPPALSPDTQRMKLVFDSCRNAIGAEHWRGIAACRSQCDWFGPNSCLEQCAVLDRQMNVCVSERLPPLMLEMFKDWRARGK